MYSNKHEASRGPGGALCVVIRCLSDFKEILALLSCQMSQQLSKGQSAEFTLNQPKLAPWEVLEVDALCIYPKACFYRAEVDAGQAC